MTITIEPRLAAVRVEGKLIPLSKREFETLLKLAEEPRRIWAPFEISPNSLDATRAGFAAKQLVGRIRESIGKDTIIARPGLGYVLAEHVEMKK